MADNNRYGVVSSVLPMSYQGRADNFARSLHDTFRALGIEHKGDDKETAPIWCQNGNVHPLHPFSSAPLSPEEEESPFYYDNNHINSNGLQHEDTECSSCNNFHGIVPKSHSIAVFNRNGTNGNMHEYSSPIFGSPVDNLLESCSSVDELYETASDHSADEDEETSNKISSSTRMSHSSVRKMRESTPPPCKIASDIHEQSETSITVSSEDENIKNIVKEENDEKTFSPIYQNQDESSEDDSLPKMRRCSSLKSGKTPPGTPGSKKIVRFADALGLDLADVKTFVDEIPKVPTSAFHDLRNLEDDSDQMIFMKRFKENKPEKTLIPIFQQPGGQPDFLDVVRKNFVCLENAMVEDLVTFAITGTVRVRNVDFHKSVFVRYSTDSWKNFIDVNATYVQNSCDGFSDKFSFLIYANSLAPGQSLEFAVVFQARGEQFWDNNKGSNYSFQCISTHTPSLAPLTHVIPSTWEDNHWGASFY